MFWSRVRNPDSFPELRRIVADEERLKQELVADLRSHRIDYVDLLTALRTAPAQPYYEDVDGHPNAVGQRVIAATVAERLSEGRPLNGDSFTAPS